MNRPSYITLELDGVNANSRLHQMPERLLADPKEPNALVSPIDVGPTFSQRAWRAIQYYLATSLLQWRFNQVAYHRNKNPLIEGACWVRGGLRKACYFWPDRRGILPWLAQHQGKVFFVPLQVHVDSQLLKHSDFESIEAYIHHVITSFAKHAPKDAVLLIKHHPMDRGYKHYGQQIKAAVQALNLSGRVRFGFEHHLPTLYPFLAGCININSTVGLSALLHHVPTIAKGNALYCLAGITSQQALADFWQQPESPEPELVERLRLNLLNETQLSGNYFKGQQATAEAIVTRLLQN